MVEFLWLLLGLSLGFAIGALAPGRDDGFVARAQKYLKKGQTFTFTMSCFDHDDDDDGGNDGFVPLIPVTEHRFN